MENVFIFMKSWKKADKTFFYDFILQGRELFSPLFCVERRKQTARPSEGDQVSYEIFQRGVCFPCGLCMKEAFFFFLFFFCFPVEFVVIIRIPLIGCHRVFFPDLRMGLDKGIKYAK